MLSVADKPVMLSVSTLSASTISVSTMCICTLSVVILNVVAPNRLFVICNFYLQCVNSTCNLLFELVFCYLNL